MAHKNANTFSIDELKRRNFHRIARLIFELWEEGRGNTNLLNDILIPDNWVLAGTSVNGGNYREHVVPRLLIYARCEAMFAEGRSIEEVAALIEKFLHIVRITKDEQKRLDVEKKLKTCMPEGWQFETGDPFARLKAAGIEFVQSGPTN